MQEEKPFNPAEAFREWLGAMTDEEKETLTHDIAHNAERLNETLQQPPTTGRAHG